MKKDRCTCCEKELTPALCHFHEQWGTVCGECYTMVQANPEFGDLKARERLSGLAKRRHSKQQKARQLDFEEWRAGK